MNASLLRQAYEAEIRSLREDLRVMKAQKETAKREFDIRVIQLLENARSSKEETVSTEHYLKKIQHQKAENLQLRQQLTQRAAPYTPNPTTNRQAESDYYFGADEGTKAVKVISSLHTITICQ